MYTTISILCVVFLLMMAWMKVLYDRKLKEMSRQWVEFFTNYTGELEANIAKLEYEEQKEDKS